MTERSEALFTLLRESAYIEDVCVRYTDVRVAGGRNYSAGVLETDAQRPRAASLSERIGRIRYTLDLSNTDTALGLLPDPHVALRHLLGGGA